MRIYTLCDLGNLSNLNGSLSRTIQQYSPPSEWIMCQLGVFPIFLLKVNKILGLTFLRKKRLGRIQNGAFPFTIAEFCARWIVYSSRLFASRRRSRCENAAFPNKKICRKNRSLFMTNKFESKCYVCKKSTFQVNRKKNNGTGRRHQLEQPSRHFCHHLMRRTTQQTPLALNLASQQKTTKLYFSSQVRK